MSVLGVPQSYSQTPDALLRPGPQAVVATAARAVRPPVEVRAEASGGDAREAGSGIALYAALRARQDAMNEQARELRARGGEGYDKQYPPYPSGYEERVAFLNSLSGLRKQVEALLSGVELADLRTPGGDATEAMAERALRLSRQSRVELAGQTTTRGLSMNRAVLEVIGGS